MGTDIDAKQLDLMRSQIQFLIEHGYHRHRNFIGIEALKEQTRLFNHCADKINCAVANYTAAKPTLWYLKKMDLRNLRQLCMMDDADANDFVLNIWDMHVFSSETTALLINEALKSFDWEAIRFTHVE